MRGLKRIIWTAVALVFLGVSWLWDTLAPVIQWLIDRMPLESVKAWVIRFMDRLPPYPTLLVFLVPIIVIEPFKLLAVWLLARGQFVSGLALFIAAEVLRFGLVAFLFKTCEEKLLSIGWFASLYRLFVRAHEWAHEQVEPVRAYIHQAFVEAGLTRGQGGIWRRLKAIWRYARRPRIVGA